jgi:hypothetical protein
MVVMIEIKLIELGLWKSSHLHFRDDGPVSPGAKTRQFSVFSSATRTLLGYVKWFPHWRKYCFYPLNSLFDDNCLEQVSHFMKEATAVHKSRLPHIKRGKDMEKARRQRRIEQLTKRKQDAIMNSEVEEDGSCIPVSELLHEMQVVEGGGLAPDVQEM